MRQEKEAKAQNWKGAVRATRWKIKRADRARGYSPRYLRMTPGMEHADDNGVCFYSTLVKQKGADRARGHSSRYLQKPPGMEHADADGVCFYTAHRWMKVSHCQLQECALGTKLPTRYRHPTTGVVSDFISSGKPRTTGPRTTGVSCKHNATVLSNRTTGRYGNLHSWVVSRVILNYRYCSPVRENG